jgi:inorganic pyrophosphatase
MGRVLQQSPYDSIKPFADDDFLQIIIETPRGCRNKFQYDEELRIFRLHSVLPAGTVFPYDFGYVPGTRGGDGDPLDVLLLMDQPAFTGCLVKARLIGVLEAEQTDGSMTERNDRLVAVAEDAHDYRDLKSLKDINANLLQELEHFFVSYNQMRNKEFRLIATRGPRAARRLVETSLTEVKKRSKRHRPSRPR